MLELTAEEVRIVGCLIEKERTVPDSYPLTVNSLVNACNQSSNRWPVVSYEEHIVTTALTSLREKKVTRIVYSQSNRAPKHRHVLDELLRLEADELAVLGVLMLRGPQTVGELRTRTERLHPFEALQGVNDTLERLAGREEPLVVDIGRQPGQKEGRWAHLLSGPVDVVALAAQLPASSGRQGSGDAGASTAVSELSARVELLEAELAELRQQVANLYEVLGETLEPVAGAGDGAGAAPRAGAERGVGSSDAGFEPSTQAGASASSYTD